MSQDEIEGKIDELLEDAKWLRTAVQKKRMLGVSEDMLDKMKQTRSTITDVVTIFRRVLKIGK